MAQRAHLVVVARLALFITGPGLPDPSERLTFSPTPVATAVTITRTATVSPAPPLDVGDPHGWWANLLQGTVGSLVGAVVGALVSIWIAIYVLRRTLKADALKAEEERAEQSLRYADEMERHRESLAAQREALVAQLELQRETTDRQLKAQREALAAQIAADRNLAQLQRQYIDKQAKLARMQRSGQIISDCLKQWLKLANRYYNDELLPHAFRREVVQLFLTIKTESTNLDDFRVMVWVDTLAGDIIQWVDRMLDEDAQGADAEDRRRAKSMQEGELITFKATTAMQWLADLGAGRPLTRPFDVEQRTSPEEGSLAGPPPIAPGPTHGSGEEAPFVDRSAEAQESIPSASASDSPA